MYISKQKLTKEIVSNELQLWQTRNDKVNNNTTLYNNNAKLMPTMIEGEKINKGKVVGTYMIGKVVSIR